MEKTMKISEWISKLYEKGLREEGSRQYLKIDEVNKIVESEITDESRDMLYGLVCGYVYNIGVEAIAAYVKNKESGEKEI